MVWLPLFGLTINKYVYLDICKNCRSIRTPVHIVYNQITLNNYLTIC